MKLRWCNWEDSGLELEIKRTSITRLKLTDSNSWERCACIRLKSKEPRLRDWNVPARQYIDFEVRTWNQKNLDYEIETWLRVACLWCGVCLKSKEPRLRDWNKKEDWTKAASELLEIKRTSITRLKPPCQKFSRATPRKLEIKRTSITRLKLKFIGDDGTDGTTWNQKNLDYEIETPFKI